MSERKNGYISGALIILAAMMLGTIIGGSLFTYGVYRKHTLALEMARQSEMQAKLAEDRMQSSATREAELATDVQELRERISELETENAELRERLEQVGAE